MSRYCPEPKRAAISGAMVESTSTVALASLTWIPHDRSVDAAAWDGEPVARGAFRHAVERLARVVCPPPTRRRRAR